MQVCSCLQLDGKLLLSEKSRSLALLVVSWIKVLANSMTDMLAATVIAELPYYMFAHRHMLRCTHIDLITVQ